MSIYEVVYYEKMYPQDMPQLDLFTFSSQLIWGFVVFTILYYFIVNSIIPFFLSTQKSKQKKIQDALSGNIPAYVFPEEKPRYLNTFIWIHMPIEVVTRTTYNLLKKKYKQSFFFLKFLAKTKIKKKKCKIK